ncbi:MAG: Foldase protein PrsA [Rhodobiaceae bacterium UBA7378]|nr:MAG: Foldase protein PrsA [Rhodobiaceae bacterium UBA7378]|tara:strand:- start:830 stop:2113 length:1284 start_codon:yes stop_codon:yes gene_type:complete
MQIPPNTLPVPKQFRVLFVLMALPLLVQLGAPELQAREVEAREVEGIAAIVNDEVISLYDVDQRVELYFVSSGIVRSRETVERLREQALRELVDEKLQLQEARRVDIFIEQEEIDREIDRLSDNFKTSQDSITDFLKTQGIKERTLTSQIEADLAWKQFIQRSFGGRVRVGDDEIEEQYLKVLRAIEQPRFLVGEILLNADSLTDQQRVARISQEIVTQLRSGVDFAAVARQFSVSPSATRGGRLGWVTLDQLDPALGNVLQQMEPGQISTPIPTNAGYYILLLQNREEGRSANRLKNQFDVLTIAFADDANTEDITGFIKGFKTCKAAVKTAESLDATSSRSGLKALSELPGPMRNAIANLEAGQVSSAQTTSDGTNVHIVCDRKDDLGVQVSRRDIGDNIFSQRLSMNARRHLRDLRRDAVVEYR